MAKKKRLRKQKIRSFARKQRIHNESRVLNKELSVFEKEFEKDVLEEQIKSVNIYNYPVSLVKKDLMRSLFLSGVVIAILGFLFFLQK